jgi:hypothetical protein
MPKEPKGVAVTYNDREYLVSSLTVYVRRQRGEKVWWHRLNSSGETARAVRRLSGKKDK